MASDPTDPRAALELLRDLSLRLADRATNAGALAELRALAEVVRDRPEGSPLRLATVHAAVGARQERLELLLLPSIFAPEEWGFTFLEGLLKLPLDEYEGRRLLEVGTGSGWICIALARLTGLSHLTGLDLNPHSAVVARCNGWLNGGEELNARLTFGESDLLSALPAEARFDLVVGCIPQVLRTEGLLPPEVADERALHDLGNYCATQDVYEDHFGLGLNARLLDEIPERLAPGGGLLLNLAGRPGRTIIERMFGRRGFATEVLLARRVRQASDTDIRPLVELERLTSRQPQGQDFEFYVEPHSPEPIRAETALGWLAAGHPIWHEVAVWQARLRLPRETLALRSAIRALGATRILPELELAAASQEQLDFAASLAARLAAAPLLPYAHEAGDLGLREQVARYLQRFFQLSLDPGELFVAPERAQAVYSLLLATCDEGDGVLISRNLHAAFAPALEKAGVRVTVVNSTLGEVRQLLAAFDVKVVFLAVEPAERTNLGALREIVDDAARRGILVVLDESAYLNIGSGVEPRTMFEFLAREPARPNLAVLYGLVKNAVFPDFELTLLLPVPERLHADLEVAAEVTYSRIGTLPQWFYERLFEGLLSFRISFGPPPPPPPRRLPLVPLPRSARMATLSAAPAFAPKLFDPADPLLIRLDHGEHEAPIPEALAAGLVVAATAPRDAGDHGLLGGVAGFLLETRGARYEPHELVLGQGVWPLLHDTFVALRRRLGRPPRVHAVSPCYGVLLPTLVAAGCDATAGTLQELLGKRGRLAPDAVVVSQPQNPLGTFLNREELSALSAWAVEERALVVSDEIFGLVNLTNPAEETVASPVTLEPLVPGITARTLILGGLAKELAAGGLRVGWLATRDAPLAAEIRRAALGRLHLVAARAAARVYAAWSGGPGRPAHQERRHALLRYLAASRRELAEKRALLLSALPQQPSETRELGGLFVAPLVTGWLGKQSRGVRLTPENLARVVHERTHVVVNDGAWCGDPSRLRLVFSIPASALQEAVRRLRAFADELG